MTLWRPAPRHQRSCLRPGDFPRPGELFAVCSIRSLTRPPPGPHPSQPHGPRARVCPPARAPCPFVRITHRASRAGPRDPGQPPRPAHAPLGRGVPFVRITHRASRAGPRDLGQPARPAHAPLGRVRPICPNHASRTPYRAARPRPACPASPCPPLGRHRPICPNRAIRASKTRIGAVAFVPPPRSWNARQTPRAATRRRPEQGSAPCGLALTPAARRRRAGRG
jgi:hypothetical protein